MDKNMHALSEEIERVRYLLTRCYGEKGQVNGDILALSHHLDRLINQYQRFEIREETMKHLRVAASL